MTLACVCLFCFVFPDAAHATSGDYATAFQQCQSKMSGIYVCRVVRAANKVDCYVALGYQPTGDTNPDHFQSSQLFPFACNTIPKPGDSACENVNINNVRSSWGGKLLNGFSICVNNVPPNGDGVVSCKVNLTPVGAPALNPNYGVWETVVSATSAGALCSDGKTADGTVYDGTGKPASDVPKGPPVPKPSEAPKICGGGSCYDPNTDQYCAVSGGQQICVPGSSGRGTSGSSGSGQGGSGSGSGACVSGLSTTVCAGPAPQGAPKPPPPPDSPISDPPSEIHSSTNTTQANPNTGANVTVNTNVYTTPGNSVSSGAKPGDSTPKPNQNCITDSNGTKKCAPDGDPGDAYCVTLEDGTKHCVPKNDKGTASGGQTCDTPAICSGDAPTCMVVTQSWLLRCGKSVSDKNGNGQPDWTEVSDADSSNYKVDSTGRGEVVNDGSGSPSSVPGGPAGVGDLDQSGFAGNTCPALPSFEVFGQTISFGNDLFCRWLEQIRAIILLVAAFISARIIASGGKS